VYACNGADCANAQPSPSRRVQSVFLESCASHLLSGATEIVRLRVNTESHLLEITPAGSNECGAQGTTLRLAPPPPQPQGPTCAGDACGPVTVSLAQSHTQALPVDHDWAVYAARRDGNAGMFLGHVHVGNPDTALRRIFAQPEGRWFEPRWQHGRFRLARAGTFASQTEAWDEWRLAAAAQQIWLADIPRGNDPSTAVVHGAVQNDAEGEAMLLPDDLVRDALRTRYGPAGDDIVPTVSEWNDIVSHLEACVVPRYQGEAAAASAHLPRDARCVHLANVIGPMQVASSAPSAQACVHRHMRVLTHDGSRVGDDLGDACVPLVTVATQGAPSAPPIATVGDTLQVTGAPSGVQLCIDDRCRALDANGRVNLDAAGLVELRLGDRAEDGTSLQNVALARVVVIDPSQQWQPVGLYTGGATPGARPWSAIDRDESDVFAFARRRQSLSFSFSASEDVAPVLNAPTPHGVSPHLASDLPVVAATTTPMPSPPPSALVVLVSRDAHCPSGTAAQVRRNALADPHAMYVDERFELYLAQYRADDQPYQCLARASFRVRPSLALVPAHDLPWFQVGLLGAPRLVAYFTQPSAIGLALPAGYAHARLPSPTDWFHWDVELSVMLTASLTFEEGVLTRTGVATAAALEFGFWRLSRLLSIGVMVHEASITWAYHDPVSGYVALNLGALFDLAEAR
jgi:hypothetical protein